MKHVLRSGVVALLLAVAVSPASLAAEPLPGNSVESLLDLARERNPDFAAMRHEAAAASERITPAGALPDPKFLVELRNITKFGEQNPTLSPSRVGSTRYLFMQDVPWFGKRDLKREIAELEAEVAKGQAGGGWSEIAAKIKAAFAQHYYVDRSERLAREILDLMLRLEKVARARYAGGLAPQQDVIRAQVEQTTMRNELIGLDTERHHLHARLNALLARPAGAPLADPERLRPLPAPAKLDEATLADRVRARNPQLFIEDVRLKAAEKNRELTYKNRYPDFSLGVSPIQVQSAIKEWELMVGINIPLQQSSRRAQERESEAMLSAARARKDAATNLALQELSENLAALTAARQQEILVTLSLLPQAEATFQSALAGYETGKVDFATLLDAQRQIRQARQNALKAQAEAQMRVAEIERLMGEDL